MSYKDNKFGQLFPTRTGTPSGAANERQMLDAIGGSEGFRKRFQTNADGSTTMLTTKNGAPQFSTTGAPQTPVIKLSAYLETGQLEWGFPGDNSPTKFDPAKWHFIDVPTSSAYLGYIKDSDGQQDNYPALSEAQESQAIGYPKVKLTPSSSASQVSNAAITDAASKAAYGPNTQLKKIIAGLFPASLFSGKMRLFMQSIYGARASTPLPLQIEVVGESVLLKYVVASRSLQFGFWAHNSPGIYTAPDGTFWLIVISQASANTQPPSSITTATAYAVLHDSSVKDLVTKYKTAGLSEAQKTQLEAYIFAASTVDIANPKLIGSFPCRGGGALAYGWKWNRSGSLASIVQHRGAGTGAGDNVWLSSTVHISFTSDGGVLGMSHAVTDHGEWTDGWGSFNIFVPSSEIQEAPLELVSLATDRIGVKPAFDFSNVAVYGYYKDDVWIPVTMSRTAPAGPYPKYHQSDSNIFYGADANVNAPNRYQRGVVFSEGSCKYESHTIYSDTVMDLAVGTAVFPGKSESGTHFYYERSVVGGFIEKDAAEVATYGTSPIAYSADLVTCRGTPINGIVTSQANRRMYVASVRQDNWGITGFKNNAWTLVIPAGDCEAVYVATCTQEVADSVSHQWLIAAEGLMSFFGYADPWAGNPGGPYNWLTWTQASEIGGGYGVSGVVTSGSDTDPPTTPVVGVRCFNTVISNVEGTPGGGYTSLFDVDYRTPYYNRGMTTYTSYGKRYRMSEGLKSPSFVGSYPFVGWA